MAFSTINYQYYCKLEVTRDAKSEVIIENYAFYVFVKQLEQN